MCEPRGVRSYLQEIPFMVASLEKVMQKGSYEESLVRSVASAVRQNIEQAVARLDSELED